MASESVEILSCPVCQDVYKDPVLLSCNHSFCVSCLQRWWRRKGERECPVCRCISGSQHPPHNLTLKTLCEAFLLEREQSSEAFCSLHSEKLKLFCLDHQEPVCLICRNSEKHHNHNFRPIEEVGQQFREELQKSLKPLQEKLKVFKEVQENYKETKKHIKLQFQHAKEEIRREFWRLHEVLEVEEEVRISAVKEEERKKRKVMKKKMKSLRREIRSLSDTIRATKEDLRTEDVSFLNSYRAAVERVQQRPLLEDPQQLSGALLDESKHLGNLRFNIWTKMNDLDSPVTLDPNTAHPGLRLSEGLTGVQWGKIQGLPDNPERFDSSCIVLSSKGLRSRSHSWVVEVGDSQHWVLGVALESIKRKGPLDSLSGLWMMGLYQGQYKVFSPDDSNFVFSKELQKIRVCLDFSTGRLHFYDPDSLIYTFGGMPQQTLFPFIGTRDKHLLKILPGSVSMISNTQHTDEEDEEDNEDEDEDSDRYLPMCNEYGENVIVYNITSDDSEHGKCCCWIHSC